jgi:hypothetical protein
LLARATPSSSDASGKASQPPAPGTVLGGDTAAQLKAALDARDAALKAMAAQGGAFGTVLQALQDAYSRPAAATQSGSAPPPVRSNPPVKVATKAVAASEAAKTPRPKASKTTVQTKTSRKRSKK